MLEDLILADASKGTGDSSAEIEKASVTVYMQATYGAAK